VNLFIDEDYDVIPQISYNQWLITVDLTTSANHVFAEVATKMMHGNQ
jgi:hypothetical protein